MSPLRLLAAVAATFATFSALAQAHRCNGPQGVYYSDRPCSASGSTTLGGYGPAVEPPPRYERPPPPVNRAPEHQRYMSGDCASLADGLRTASSRGLSLSTLGDLQRDYQHRCAADEQQARHRLAQEQQREYRSRGEQQAKVSAETRRAEVEQQTTVAQCGEMRRIIANKHERIATLTPGEVNDLKRFEANYAARCGARSTP